jgi:hypothetical protein
LAFKLKIAFVTIRGMVGSTVSIMLRIQKFSHLRGEHPSTLFITDFIKPLIGTLFSLFVLALASSEILPLDYELI